MPGRTPHIASRMLRDDSGGSADSGVLGLFNALTPGVSDRGRRRLRGTSLDAQNVTLVH